MQFEDLYLDPLLLDGIADLRFREMTAIQARAIPLALKGSDVIGAAQTGTGKTAAFLIPLIDRLLQLEAGQTRGLVLTPTRELALQIDTEMTGLAYHAGISSACIIGGTSFGDQEHAIRERTDVLIATPGRLIDHMRFDHVDLSAIEFLVLDEADRMLDMGFLPAVRDIVSELPQERQTLLFSATIDKRIKALAGQFMHEPKEVRIGRQVPVKAIRQQFLQVAPRDKDHCLVDLLKRDNMDSVLVFARTKRAVRQLERSLSRKGIACDALHSDKEQNERVEALERFRRGDVSVLVATDIASRGLDVADVSHVVNYDIPVDPDDYIHRVGRTARAKKKGDAITFVTREDNVALSKIEKALGQKIKPKEW